MTMIFIKILKNFLNNKYIVNKSYRNMIYLLYIYYLENYSDDPKPE